MDSQRTVPVDAGPAGQALGTLLRDPGWPAWPPELARDALRVEQCRRPVGDFGLDVSRLVPRGVTADGPLCRRLAAALESRGPILRAVAVPPRIYLRVDAAFLADEVAGAVLRDPERFGAADEGGGRGVVMSFSNPNANKPLHVGHLRNNLLGMALGNLFEARGHRVSRAVIVSDWGVHVCQAMLAYQRWGEGATPASAGVSGDRLVGRQLVRFHTESGARSSPPPGGEDATGGGPLDAEAQAMLRRLDAGDPELVRLNRLLTGWARDGFARTYARIGTRFDCELTEADDLAATRRLIAAALADGRCERRDDGSVHADLTAPGFWDVTLLRRDGTATVYGQQIGPKVALAAAHDGYTTVAVFGRDWESSFAANQEMYRRFGYAWADRLEGVSHGMVALPEGRMRSRYGTIVGADGLLDDVVERLRGAGADGAACEALGTALVKYHLLRVQRRKDIVHDDEGLWATVLPRFAMLLRALAGLEGGEDPGIARAPAAAEPGGRDLALALNAFPEVVGEALALREPALLVRYLDRTGALASACRGALEHAPRMRRAVGAVLRRGLALLNVALPSPLEELPPAFSAGARSSGR